MSVEENIALVNRWFKEVWNERRIQTIYDIIADDGVTVGQDQPGVELRGPQQFEEFVQRIYGAFSDIKMTVEDVIAVDDKVVARWSGEMRHTGDTLGMPPTNKTVRITGISIVQVANGKVIRGWDNWDQLSLMQQLSATAAAG